MTKTIAFLTAMLIAMIGQANVRIVQVPLDGHTAVSSPIVGTNLRPQRNDHYHVFYLPYVPGPGVWPQGFVRFANYGPQDTAFAQFINDRGRVVWSASLPIAAYSTTGYNSDDMAGQTAKSQSREVGVEGLPDSAGSAPLWVRLETSAQVFVTAFSRSKSGFITDLSTALVSLPGRDVNGNLPVTVLPIVNPGSNHKIRGVFRYINPMDRTLYLDIKGYDDDHVRQGTLYCDIPPFGAVTLYADQAESGNFPLSVPCRGQLGDGQGKWQLEADADTDQDIYGALAGLLSVELGILSNLTNPHAIGLEFGPD